MRFRFLLLGRKVLEGTLVPVSKQAPPSTQPRPTTPDSFGPLAFTLRVTQCEITRPNCPDTGRFLAGLRPLCKCAWAEEMIEINNYGVGS